MRKKSSTTRAADVGFAKSPRFRNRNVSESFFKDCRGPFWSIRATPVALTADPRLWHQAENHIGTNEIDIATMKPRRLDAMSYVCFAVAKDIITGSKIVALTELGDASMLPPRYFLVIQTAMLIRGYGLSAANRLLFTERRDQNELRQK